MTRNHQIWVSYNHVLDITNYCICSLQMLIATWTVHTVSDQCALHLIIFTVACIFVDTLGLLLIREEDVFNANTAW